MKNETCRRMYPRLRIHLLCLVAFFVACYQHPVSAGKLFFSLFLFSLLLFQFGIKIQKHLRHRNAITAAHKSTVKIYEALSCLLPEWLIGCCTVLDIIDTFRFEGEIWPTRRCKLNTENAPHVSLAPKTPFPFPFKRLPRRLNIRVIRKNGGVSVGNQGN